MKRFSSWMIFIKFIHSYYGIQVKKLYGYKLVGAAEQSEKMQQVVQKESREAVWTIYLEEKVNIQVIYCVFKWMKTFVDSFFFRSYLFLSHCFSLLATFLSFKSTRNNLMHVESLITTSIYFLLKRNWKRKLENCFLGTRVRAPKLV